jgi:hypothetical protein
MAMEWDPSTLLDEADVFMADTTHQSTARNELGSILLRELE